MLNNRKFLITGVTSIHGWPILEYFKSKVSADNLFAIRPPKMRIPEGANIKSACITDTENLSEIKKSFNPTHVIHAAGVCDLDVCEARPEWAFNLNVGGAKAVFDTFSNSAKIIYMSSDLVFSGTVPPSNGYDESHDPDPVSVVGKTFYEAEKVILKSNNNTVLRIGLPYGKSITNKKGVVDWIEGRLIKNRPVTLFHDEIRSSIDCDKIGEIVFNILSKDLCGLYHYGGETAKSIYDIGEEILIRGGYEKSLLKRVSRLDEENGPPRVGNSTLCSKKLMGEL